VIVGAPLITPAEESPSPGGKAPKARDQEYGVPPPVAVRVAEYGAAKVPAGKDGVVIKRVCARSSGPQVNVNISTTSERKAAFNRVACAHLFDTFIGLPPRPMRRLQTAAHCEQQVTKTILSDYTVRWTEQVLDCTQSKPHRKVPCCGSG